MIEAITKPQELDKLWRNTLSEQGNLQLKNIINGLSIRGVELANYITKHVAMSYSLKNIVVVFEIALARSDENISMEEEDDNLTEYTAFILRLSIYGNAAIEFSKMLKARLESAKCRDDLYNKGIFFDKVSELIEMNDFINETMWTKVNMSIDFSCRLSFTQKDKYEDFDTFDNINVEVLH